MPIITINLIVERDSENEVKKHFLNHEDYHVYETKGHDDLFTMVIKKPKKDESKNKKES